MAYAIEDAADYNKALEAQELVWLQTHPDKVMLYVQHPELDMRGRVGNAHYCDVAYRYKIITWMGTPVAVGANCWVGDRARVGWGRDYRRPVRATIFGVLYHGWYMESSGDYCRLKKAKRQ